MRSVDVSLLRIILYALYELSARRIKECSRKQAHDIFRVPPK